MGVFVGLMTSRQQLCRLCPSAEFSVDFGLRDDHVRSGRRLRRALAGACSKLIGNGFVMHGAVMQVLREGM